MREQHLSDEAVAAFADDVLPKNARERARRHTSACPECAYAVAVQREAVWALRAAPAPALPTGLLDRLRDVPVTTPIRTVPSGIDDEGNALLATFAAPAAAFVPAIDRRESGRVKPLAITAAASLAAAGVVAGMYLANGSSGPAHPAGHVAHIQPASVRVPAVSH